MNNIGYDDLGYTYLKVYGNTLLFRICRRSLALEHYIPNQGWAGGYRYSLRRVVNETIPLAGKVPLFGETPSYYLELSLQGCFDSVVQEITEREARRYINKLNMLEGLSK